MKGGVYRMLTSQQDKGSADVCLYFLFIFYMCKIRFSDFKRQRSWIASFLPQGGPLWGLGWSKENHPRFAAVFSFAKPCAKRQSKGRRPIKSGKHIPMGLFILKNLKI